MVFDTDIGVTGSEIGSIITELDLDSITMEMDKPEEPSKEDNLQQTPPSEVSDILQQVKDAPLKENLEEIASPQETTPPTIPDETTPPTTEIPTPAETSDTLSEPAKDKAADTSTDVYASFAKAVYEEGVFSEFNQEEFTKLASELGSPAKALIELNKRTIEHYVQNEIDSYPEEIRKLAKNYQDGIPLDELIQIQSDEIRLNNVTDETLAEDEDLRRQMIIEDLKNRGFTEGEAGEEYKLYVESAIDDKRAVQARDRLILKQEEVIKTKADQAQETKKNRIKAIEDSRENLKEKVNAAKEFIPGIEVNNRDKSLVFNALTKPVARDARGNELNEIMMTRAKNPIHFDTMVAYLYTKGVFNVDEKGNPAPKTTDLFKGKTSETITNLEKQMNSFGKQFHEQGSSATVEGGLSEGSDHMIKHLNF